jgi:hypothetical protein
MRRLRWLLVFALGWYAHALVRGRLIRRELRALGDELTRELDRDIDRARADRGGDHEGGDPREGEAREAGDPMHDGSVHGLPPWLEFDPELRVLRFVHLRPLVTCSWCGGTGEPTDVCSKCGGTGVVPV